MTLTPEIEQAIREDGQTIADAALKRATNNQQIACAADAIFAAIRDPTERRQMRAEWLAAFDDPDA